MRRRLVSLSELENSSGSAPRPAESGWQRTLRRSGLAVVDGSIRTPLEGDVGIDIRDTHTHTHTHLPILIIFCVSVVGVVG